MSKPFEIRLIFDSKSAAKDFVSGWLDGGGDQMCGFYTVYAESDKWDKWTPTFLRLKQSEPEPEGG